jgi:hypothetical protein
VIPIITTPAEAGVQCFVIDFIGKNQNIRIPAFEAVSQFRNPLKNPGELVFPPPF